MPIFRWGNAFDAFLDLELELNRMMRTVATAPVRSGRRFPAVNLMERPDEYLVTALLPGVDGDALDVSVSGGMLTLSGERTRPADVDEAQYRRSERPSGRFERSITLPERVDEDAIAADFKHGVLKLTLPKMAPPPSRRISVTHDGENAGRTHPTVIETSAEEGR